MPLTTMNENLDTPTTETVSPIRDELERRIQDEQLELPLLPKVAGRVLSMAGDESAKASSLSSLIQQDQALAGHVMRVANSAMFQARTPMVSLQQAIARLGLQLLGEIALAASVHGKVFNVAGHKAQVSKMWKHALASGAWGKELARLRRRNVESAYLCGLLHRIGRPVVLQTVVDIAAERSVILGVDELNTLLDQHEIEVGGLMSVAWALPDTVATCVTYHSSPGRAPSHEDEVLTTHCAGRLAEHLFDPETVTEDDIRALEGLAQLNLYPDEVDALLQRREEIVDLVELLNV